MLRNAFMSLGVLAMAGAALAQTAAAPDARPGAAGLTVDEIVERHVAARGGMARLKSIHTIRMTGRMTVGPGMEAPVLLEIKRPHRMRLEMRFQGMTVVQAFDGTSGWTIMPFSGRKDPQPMSADDMKEAEETSDIDGFLVDYKAKGHRVELLGKESVEGADAYKLKVTLKNGDVRYVYLGSESFLDIRSEGKRNIRGSETEMETSFGDYKDVGGLTFPHSVEGGPRGSPQRQKITIEKIELNVPVDEARFRMPAAEAEPAVVPRK